MRWFIRILAVVGLAIFAAGLLLNEQGRSWIRRVAEMVVPAPADSPAGNAIADKDVARSTADERADTAGEPGTPLELIDPVTGEVIDIIAPAADSRSVVEPGVVEPESKPSPDQLPPDNAAQISDDSQDGAKVTAQQVLAAARQRELLRAKQLRQGSRLPRGPAQPPHVLLLIVSDLNREDLGCYGQPLIQTPYVDGLAAEGARLARFAGLSAGQAAEVDALRTGDLPLAGAKGTSAGGRGTRVTLPEVLAQAGYTPAIIGDCSWAGVESAKSGVWDHCFGWNQAATPLPEGTRLAEAVFAEYPRQVWSDGQLLRVVDNEQADAIRFERLLLGEAARWLDQQKLEGRSVALIVHLRLSWWTSSSHVHAAYRENAWLDAQKRHASAVTVVDRMVGEFTKRIDALDGSHRALVMVIGLPRQRRAADLDLFRTAMSANDLQPDAKPAPWPYAPLVLRATSTVPSSEVFSSKCGFHDILPTLAEMVAAPRAPRGVEGRSQLSEWLQLDER